MEISKPHLLLKRVINVKVVVTPRWKEDTQQQLQAQINQLDGQLQQLEIDGQRTIGEIQRQSTNPSDPVVVQQVNNVQVQINQRRSDLLGKKNQILQQLQQVQLLDLDQEVSTGQIEGFFRVETGDNLIRKMQVELLLRDGIVEEIRGDV
ncbi:YlqD family protein [Leptolyngbya sp. FACHB-711]|uniref:YlqD family protein n=1 Tax=unclassified Leptolyngbya TaxID=2650499 RepID=UPI0016893634|nr:YlqD family protein [Leptolyngbya sp. FACHB-711]MBD1853488.1 YlqD family protein [Cyanobacteria bacterium FACHB-502]MBD2026367.1 YlqD family protein [Leptolyngbya sp. FACHB-711]